jgi:hypothetical protein
VRAASLHDTRPPKKERDETPHPTAHPARARFRGARRRHRSGERDSGRPAAGRAVSTISTKHGQLIAVALPSAPARSGLVWRIARRYDSRVVREVSEANVGRNVVVVFKVVGTGRTSIVFAQTRGDASSKAVAAITHNVRAS